MTQRPKKSYYPDEGGGGALWLVIYLNGTAVGDLMQLLMVVLLWNDGKRRCSGDDVAFGRRTLMLGPSTWTELEPLTNDDLLNASTSSVTLIWTRGTVTNGRIPLRQVL